MTKPRTYRLIPVQVEAIKLSPKNVSEASLWSGAHIVDESESGGRDRRDCALRLPTLRGVLRATYGDYIIKRTTGDFDVMASPEFNKTYELIE